MQLTHKIMLKLSPEQTAYFIKAAGTSRFVWNWGLAEWNKQYASGKKPNAMALKKQFNAIKYQEYPWLKEMHRDSHSQPFTYLAKAWERFFNAIKSNTPAHKPRLKKKNRSRDSFYVANDKFHVNGKSIYLPRIGLIEMTEELRFEGKILGATVSRTANRWFIAIQVDVPEEKAKKKRNNHETIGVDFGIKAAATLSTGETISSQNPLRSALRRLKIRSRSVSRKIEASKKIGSPNRMISNNQKKSILKLSILHARIANLRADFTHKLTTRLCCENQTVVIEDLHVSGMLKNEKLSRALSDVGFGRIRRQLEYKGLRYDTKIMIADKWYPSSKLCSYCGLKNDSLKLADRSWQCTHCDTYHDRDINAAINLKRLATVTALPEASQAAMHDTGIEFNSIPDRKVTPVSYECGLQDTSGQEKNSEHTCSHF